MQAPRREHHNDFDILWVCRDCGYRSIYHRDLEDHKYRNDHHKVAELSLETGRLRSQYTQRND